jgi:hypothetical protein
MRPRILLAAALLLPFVASCDSSTAPDGLNISAVMEQLEIENTTDEAVYTFVMEERDMPLVDWMPCIADDCGRIPPGDTRTLTYEALGTEPGQRVRIYYWRVVFGPADEPSPGPVSMRTIRLPIAALAK